MTSKRTAYYHRQADVKQGLITKTELHAACGTKTLLPYEDYFLLFRLHAAGQVDEHGIPCDFRNERNIKAVHSNLSEELLSGGPEPKSFSYTASRRRFEIETVPKRKAAEHDFHQDYSFTSAETKAMSVLWYAVLAAQPDMKMWLSTCEQIAFNLGEQRVSLDSIRRGHDESCEGQSFHRHGSKAGPSDNAEEGLGAAAARCAQPSSVFVSLWDHHALQGSDGRSVQCRSYWCRWFHRQALWRGAGDSKQHTSMNSMQTWRRIAAMLLWEELRCVSPNLTARAVSALKICHSACRSVAGMWEFKMHS